MADIRNTIAELAAPVAAEYGVEIVDVEMAGSARRPTVRLFIDKAGGVTLEDCEKVSRELSAVLDVEDPFRTSYTLEVSSPGLDRPLKRLKDFEASVGKLARVVTVAGIDGQNFFVGRITGVKEESIRLMVEGKGDIDIPFGNISRARLEIEFK